MAKQQSANDRLLDLVARWITARNAERDALTTQDECLREAIAMYNANPTIGPITLADGSRWALHDNFASDNTIFRSVPTRRFVFKQVKV